MKKIISLIALIMLLMGCGSSTSSNDIDLNNVLSLTYQQALKKGVVECVEDSMDVDINFGCFFQSGTRYGQLSNNTNYELTEINITSSNPAFDISPSYIASMGAPNKSTGMTPIIRFSILHGTPLNTLGTESTMPRGANTSTITITGKVDGQDFSVEYVIGGTAKTIELERRGDSCVLSGPMYVGGYFGTNDGDYVDNYEFVRARNGNNTYCSISIIEMDSVTTLAVPNDIIKSQRSNRREDFAIIGE